MFLEITMILKRMMNMKVTKEKIEDILFNLNKLMKLNFSLKIKYFKKLCNSKTYLIKPKMISLDQL
jgi:hypothetical protein